MKVSSWRTWFPATLRLRLALWYTLSLGLILALFAVYLYIQIERTLIAQVDAALDLAAAQAMLIVGDTNGELAFQAGSDNPDIIQNLSDDFIVQLLSPDGTVLATLSSEPGGIAFSAQAPGYSTHTIEGDPWRLYRRPARSNGASGWIQTAQELDLVFSTLASLRTQIVWVIPLGLALAGLGGYFLATRALRPIDALTRIAQASNASDLSLRTHYRGPEDEVGRLAQTFDRMLDRLESAFARERQFTADTAHELRTPLAALKGRIGVTLSRQRQPPEYQETLRGMEEQVDRLIRLTNDLLFIARLEGGQLEPQMEGIDAGDFLGAVIDQVRPLIDAKSITLLEEVPSGLAIQADFNLLTRLFLNLLDNAVRYTPQNGQIRIEARQREQVVEFSIQDGGQGIETRHIPFIFDRFYRVEGDRSRSSTDPGEGGAGLGLAIAREIAGVQGGELSVKSEPGKGATFTLLLPS
jgi:heavy metal sensor kinase